VTGLERSPGWLVQSVSGLSGIILGNSASQWMAYAFLRSISTFLPGVRRRSQAGCEHDRRSAFKRGCMFWKTHSRNFRNQAQNSEESCYPVFHGILTLA
jgi:hypothetical protein